MTEDQKRRIDHYIQIYLSDIQSVSNDAGFETYSILARLIDFQGYLPAPSGNDQSNMSLEKAMRLVRPRHAKAASIAGAVVMLLHTQSAPALALLAKNYYVGQCEWTKKMFTDADRAGEIKQDVRSYRYNLHKAYPAFRDAKDLVERLKEFYGAVDT